MPDPYAEPGADYAADAHRAAERRTLTNLRAVARAHRGPDVDHDAHVTTLTAALDQLDAFAHDLAQQRARAGAVDEPGPEPDQDILRTLGNALGRSQLGTRTDDGGAGADADADG